MLNKFFHSRSVTGFYLPLCGAVLAFVSAILYQVHYAGTQYYSLSVFLLSLFAFLIYGIFSVFPKTEKFASLAQETLSFVSLLLFFLNTYLYLSTVFYSGINKESLASLDRIYVCVFFFDLLSIVFSNIGIYHSPEKTSDTKESISHD